MTIRDLFTGWEGPGMLVVRNGVETLMLETSVIPPDQTWFLRIVQATSEEREAIEEAGYLVKEA